MIAWSLLDLAHGTSWVAKLPPLERLVLFLQNDIDRLDDCSGGIRLAIDDHVVNSVFGAAHIKRVLFCKAIVPAAVPNPEKIGVFLKGARKLRAGQLLDIDIAVGIGIVLQLDLRLRDRPGARRTAAIMRERRMENSLPIC